MSTRRKRRLSWGPSVAAFSETVRLVTRRGPLKWSISLAWRVPFALTVGPKNPQTVPDTFYFSFAERKTTLISRTILSTVRQQQPLKATAVVANADV
jgi:hypothetical protein